MVKLFRFFLLDKICIILTLYVVNCYIFLFYSSIRTFWGINDLPIIILKNRVFWAFLLTFFGFIDQFWPFLDFIWSELLYILVLLFNTNILSYQWPFYHNFEKSSFLGIFQISDPPSGKTMWVLTQILLDSDSVHPILPIWHGLNVRGPCWWRGRRWWWRWWWILNF